MTKKQKRRLQVAREKFLLEALKRANAGETLPIAAQAYIEERTAKLAQPSRKHVRRDDFYRTEEWKRARYEALRLNGGRCECCGARGGDVQLNVDHKIPLSRAWALRLEPSNLQVLCASCNWGKGNHDSTDWTG